MLRSWPRSTSASEGPSRPWSGEKGQAQQQTIANRRIGGDRAAWRVFGTKDAQHRDAEQKPLPWRGRPADIAKKRADVERAGETVEAVQKNRLTI